MIVKKCYFKGWAIQPLLFKSDFLWILTVLLSLTCPDTHAQEFDLQKEISSPDYKQTKNRVEEKFKNIKPGKFGEFLPGTFRVGNTNERVLALTFDACGGPKSNGFDKDLIEFLKKEKIQATLFVTGQWIAKNIPIFQQLCGEPLFEIENHGLTHHPCTVGTESKYGIHGTGSVGAAIDEIELSARQIEFYSHRKPVFYRSATAYVDEGCLSIAHELNEAIVSYEVLSGDAVAGVSADAIKDNIIKKTKPGAIVIMHMNHPERNGFEALRAAIPVLREKGYRFVKLEQILPNEKK